MLSLNVHFRACLLSSPRAGRIRGFGLWLITLLLPCSTTQPPKSGLLPFFLLAAYKILDFFRRSKRLILRSLHPIQTKGLALRAMGSRIGTRIDLKKAQVGMRARATLDGVDFARRAAHRMAKVPPSVLSGPSPKVFRKSLEESK